MKKCYLLGIALLLFSSLSAQHSGDTFSSAKSSKSANLTYVYVGVNGFATMEANGEMKGLFVEMMNEFEGFILEKHGIKINGTYKVVQGGDFQKFLDEVKDGSGGVFGLNTTTIKEERKTFLSFSPAVLNNISVLISHKSVPTLSNINSISTEFSSLEAYTAPGTTYEKRIMDLKSNDFPSLKVNLVPSEYDIIDNVLENRNSFGFMDISFYLEYLNQKKPIKRHPIGDQGGEQYGIIMPLGSDWEPVIADFLNSGFVSSSKYRQIVIDNLGKGALRMLD